MAGFTPFPSGVGMIDKDQVNLILSQGGLGQGLTTASYTARAGGTQALGTAMNAACMNIAVCATSGDSVCMPAAIGGQALYVVNAGAASCNIFSSNAAPTDTINGTVGTTAYALAAGKATNFVSFVAGAWRVILSA